MKDRFLKRVRQALEQLPQTRTLQSTQPLAPARVRIHGRELIDFGSNDYLGLSRHPEVIEAACLWSRRDGAGATASRLLGGNHPAYSEIEATLAGLKGTGTALILASGFTANVSVLATLLDRRLHGGWTTPSGVEVFADRLVHASIHGGIAMAGARLHRFRHNDLSHLEELLVSFTKRAATAGASPEVLPVIVTESVFSMDGDRADLKGLRELASRFGALLYIDEAHATGVLGPGGAGLAAERESGSGHSSGEVVVSTFGKALGSFGACVACAPEVREYLVNRCAGLIYATAIPPSVLGSIQAALRLLPSLEPQRVHLQFIASRFRDAMRAAGLETGPSTTHIVPVIIGEEPRTMEVAEKLRERGFQVGAIRPPTVPPGTARLRISFSSVHTVDEVDALAAACLEAMK